MRYDLRRVLIFFLILVLPAFIVKEYQVLKAARQSYIYQPVESEVAARKEYSFVFALFTQNQAEGSIRALTSIFTQDYEKYRILLIDNGSFDGSFQKVQSFLMNRELKSRNIMMIRHKDPVSEMALMKDVLKECHQDEIVVLLDANNWLVNEGVLATINEAYQDSEVWLTYGSYLDYPSFRKGQQMHANTASSLRSAKKTPWVKSGLRTFKAGLMKDIDLDLVEEQALFDSMLDLAKWHIRYIPESLYVRNRLQMDQQDHTMQLGLRLDQLTDSLAAQALLAKTTPASDAHSDMIIFSNNRPFQLNVSLESIYRYVRGLDQVHVIYVSDDVHEQAYRDVIEQYPSAHFRAQENMDFKSYLVHLLKEEDSGYVALATDGLLIKDPIHFQDCAGAMEQTKAFAFFLDPAALSIESKKPKDRPERIHLIEMEPARVPSPFNMVLYRKSDLLGEFSGLEFVSMQTLLSSWRAQSITKKYGLYYDSSRVVTVGGHWGY